MQEVFSPEVRTKVGNRFMVSSQSVPLTGENPEVEVFLDDWSCVVRFLSDDGKARYKVNEAQAKLYLDLFNHASVKGQYMYTPILIAQTDKWKIFITYWTKIYPGSKSLSRLLDYSIWVEEIV